MVLPNRNKQRIFDNTHFISFSLIIHLHYALIVQVVQNRRTFHIDREGVLSKIFSFFTVYIIASCINRSQPRQRDLKFSDNDFDEHDAMMYAVKK